MNWKLIVQNIAPILGSVLGGPLGGIATQFLSSRLLGKENATNEELEKAIAFGNPEFLAKLKQLDLDFKSKLESLNIDYEKIKNEDTANARQRQISMHDWTPNILGIIVFFAYFFIVRYQLVHHVDGLDNLLARVQDLVMLVASYFFGSMFKNKRKP